MSIFKILNTRLLLANFNFFFYNYTNYLSYKSSAINFFYFFRFHYLNLNHMVLYWFIRHAFFCTDTCQFTTFPTHGLFDTHVHTTEWCGYFSSRNYLYKKLNERIGYNRFVWENRLIGDGLNNLCGNSYVYRLQSRKNNTNLLFTEYTTVRNVRTVAASTALKRQHFSYKMLGYSLLNRADPLNAILAVGYFKRWFFRFYSIKPQHASYLRTKCTRTLMRHYQTIALFHNKYARLFLSKKKTSDSLLKSASYFYTPQLNVANYKALIVGERREFNTFLMSTVQLRESLQNSQKRSGSAELLYYLTHLAKRHSLSGNLGSQLFDITSNPATFFRFYKKNYFSFVRVRSLNTCALFTSLLGRRHRSKIILAQRTGDDLICRKRKLYFYVKILPKLKHKLRRRKCLNYYKRATHCLAYATRGRIRTKLWWCQSVLSLQYWSRHIVQRCQMLRYFRNFFFYFSSIKLIKYFSFFCQQFDVVDTVFNKQLCFLHAYSFFDKQYSDDYKEDDGDTYLYIYKLLKHCSRYLSAHAQNSRTTCLQYDTEPALLFNYFIFQNKHSRVAFFKKMDSILHCGIRFIYQPKTYLTVWRLYNVQQYKCPIQNTELILPENKIPAIFTAVATAITPKDPVEITNMYVANPIAVTYRGYTFLPHTQLTDISGTFDILGFYSNVLQQSMLLYAVEVYRVLTVLQYAVLAK